MSARERYREGDWFATPLGDGRYVLGRIARHSNSIVFGYFFAPPFDHLPTLEEIGDPQAEDSFAQMRFSYLGLRDGEWPVLGQTDNWDRDAWPLPEFESRLEITGRPTVLYAVQIDEKTVSRELNVRRVDASEAGKRPEVSLYGAVAVAIHLQQMLSDPG